MGWISYLIGHSDTLDHSILLVLHPIRLVFGTVGIMSAFFIAKNLDKRDKHNLLTMSILHDINYRNYVVFGAPTCRYIK